MGVQREVISEGDGHTFPRKGQLVEVHYTGTLENGKKFDSSRDRGKPFTFTIGHGEVIRGWDDGVAMMSLGERAILKCSSDFAYGAKGIPGVIPPNATMGTMMVELYWHHAPKACRNFAELSHRGYYNGTLFHRIIPDFIVQGGDPTGTGRGGSSIYGTVFEDEIAEDLRHTGAGILSMANAGPNTNGSQFFFTLAPCQWLDGRHTIFGRLCLGIKVLQRIGMVETDSSDCPLERISILKSFAKWQK